MIRDEYIKELILLFKETLIVTPVDFAEKAKVSLPTAITFLSDGASFGLLTQSNRICASGIIFRRYLKGPKLDEYFEEDE